MIYTPTDDKPGFVAEEPEHCHDCCRLIRPGQTYHQRADNTVLCPSCFSSLKIGEDFETFPAANDLAVDVGGGLLRVRREGAAIVVKSQEVRHLVDALVERANQPHPTSRQDPKTEHTKDGSPPAQRTRPDAGIRGQHARNKLPQGAVFP